MKIFISLCLTLLPAIVLIRDWKFHDRRTRKHHNFTRAIIIFWFAVGIFSIIIMWQETSIIENLHIQNEQILASQDTLITQNKELMIKINEYQIENKILKDELAEQQEKTFDFGKSKNGFVLYNRATTLSKYFQEAVGHYNKNDLISARKILDLILQKDPNHIDSLNLLGIILNQTGNPNEALECYNKAYELSKNPKVLENINIIAVEYYKKNDLISAQKILNLILQKDPNHIDSLNLLGIILNETGNPNEALECMNKAYELSKNPNILENINTIKKYPGRRIKTIYE